MKERYSVDIYRLKPGTHEFEFEINDELFDQFPESPVKRASGTVSLELNKQERLIQAGMKFAVQLPLVCDRSLKEFEYPVNEDHEVIFKYGESEEELDDYVYIITKNTQKIDFSQFLYEFIILSVPMKKLHPDLELEESGDEIIYQSEPEETDDSKDEAIDPRWEKLKNLKK